MKGLVIGLVARLLFALPCYAQRHEPQHAPTDADLSLTQTDPAAYLNQALDEMQKQALRRNTVDWDSLRAQAHNKAANAKLTVDTYDAIRFALASLSDHHSSFHPTPALEQLEAERKGHPVQDDNTPQGPMSPFVGR